MESAYHPAFGSVVNYERTVLSDDPDEAVAQTIRQMAAYARADSGAPSIRKLAESLQGVDQPSTINRVWNWIRQRVRFAPDAHVAAPVSNNPNIAEVLVRPVDMLRMHDAQGDCDDFAMLGACLFRCMGIPAAFVTVAADPAYPDQFSHVYLEVAGQPFDASHGSYMGWEVPNRFGKRQLWNVEDGMPLLRQGPGLSGLGFDAGSTASTYIQQAIDTARQILTQRYGVPPPGTTIQTQQGTISTLPPAGAGLQLPTGYYPTGSLTSGVPSWVWIGGAFILVFMFAGRRR